MPDLLTHVLIGYTLGTLLTTRFDWPQTMTTIVMLGALLPDLTKIKLLIPDAQMQALLGIPFSWHALHTLGGVLTTATIGALLVDRTHRQRVFGLLITGTLTHLILDSLLIKPSGYASTIWWPFITTGLPTPGLYVSYDRWPALLAGLLALTTYLSTRRDPLRFPWK
ncbi:metal-dependent hydrolase [Halobacterium salinarum]|uniref:metal-dependent hydrolase n=1 Tax=Halobacterium salinarum TaxID=2242 RepID=UPI0025536FDC|nr:metal-dependent hydrolase [Halobacterium salinarum]MDL0132053.1 metal-dependent hydrolase [Halobacterium salinarum]